jgi:hypothetical protein
MLLARALGPRAGVGRARPVAGDGLRVLGSNAFVTGGAVLVVRQLR